MNFNNASIYKCGVAHINGDTHSMERYFDKCFEVNLSKVYDPMKIYRNNTIFELEEDNPSFYDIVECLLEAHFSHQHISALVFGHRILFIEEIGELSIEKQQANVTQNTLYMFENEIDMIRDNWTKYVHYEDEAKLKFWRRYIIKRMHRLFHFGYNPYLMYSPQVFDFWLLKEPNIAHYIKELTQIPNSKFDLIQIETHLQKPL